MSLKHLADELAARGRYGDTELVHMTKGEVAGLQSLAEAAGGSLTVNPDTGKPEAFFLAALLPTILGGVGASMGLGALGTAALGAGVGALSAKAQDRNPLMGAIMGGMGGYGGGQLAGALQGAGANAAQQAAMQAAPELANQAVGQGLQAGGTQGLQMAGTQGLQMGTVAPQLVGETAAQNTLAAQATGDFLAQPYHQQMGAGIQSLGSEAGRDTALQALGGAKGALKSGSMAAAPAMYDYMTQMPEVEEEEETVLPRYDYTAGLTGDYYGMGGDNSTRERGYFTQPTFTRRAAQGGIMQLAEGGDTDPKDPAQGMTGASAEAMRYLMGQTASSRPAQPAASMFGGNLAQAISTAPTGQRSLFNVSGGTTPRTDRQFMYDQATHSVMRNPNYVDPKIERDRLAALASSVGNPYDFSEGGLAELAKGGMKAGGFVVPADVVSMVGEGNTEAGYKDIARAIPGATPIRGKDGGQADTVKTSIEGKQPARVAHGEMYVPPEAVKRAGGAKKLYAMMDKVRKQAKGDTKQIKPVDLRKALA
jgi:hypothetical protein